MYAFYCLPCLSHYIKKNAKINNIFIMKLVKYFKTSKYKIIRYTTYLKISFKCQIHIEMRIYILKQSYGNSTLIVSAFTFPMIDNHKRRRQFYDESMLYDLSNIKWEVKLQRRGKRKMEIWSKTALFKPFYYKISYNK